MRERRRLFSQQELIESSGTMKNRTMKQLYCLLTIFFCTNSQCSMPLQYLLSDAILCLGGSTELVKIFNRIGAVASLDTHDCVATCAVTDRIAKGIRFELEPRSLTVVSIDSIDILQRHGVQYRVQKKLAWNLHQCPRVSCSPKGIVLSEHEFHCATQEKLGNEPATKTENSTAHSRKHCSSSPAMSPAPKQVEKRRKTL